MHIAKLLLNRYMFGLVSQFVMADNYILIKWVVIMFVKIYMQYNLEDTLPRPWIEVSMIT